MAFSMATRASISRPTKTTRAAMQRLLNSSGFVQPIPTAAPQAVERPGSVGSTRAHDRDRSTFNSSAAVALAIFIGAAARVLPPLLAGPIQRELNWSDSEITWPIVISIAL